MKAAELLAKLKSLVDENGDHEVFIEGCDCIGRSDGVEFKRGLASEEPWFYIRRDDTT